MTIPSPIFIIKTTILEVLSNMFIIFKSPVVFAQSYSEACQIADAHYQSTGEIVAVENVNNSLEIN